MKSGFPLRKPPYWGNIKQEANMSDEAAIESEIQRKGLNAPRLTPDAIDAQIVGEDYHRFPGTTMTVCCLTLANGFNVTGESAAASPSNFDEEIGRTIARRLSPQAALVRSGKTSLISNRTPLASL
jgi:hypothetical protein